MRQNKVYTFETLKTTVHQLHAQGTKALLTMNIFPRNVDIAVFESVVEQISDINPDGIIFSDPGTFQIIKKYLPTTPLHLSTQTTTLNYAGVKFWSDLGVRRIILARELHINEIAKIKKEVPEIELEVFVHGAMCMTYSGRCLLGDYLGGRPANKGECNHACRFTYKVFIEEERRSGKLMEVTQDDDGEHILSSRDLCTIERLAEILPHVDGLKIEGRSKSEFYVAAITKAYKHVRDAIVNGTPIDEKIRDLVHVIPHRSYREGFLFHPLKEFPDGECVSERGLQTTGTTAGPLFNRNYFGTFTPEHISIAGKTYHHINPKEELKREMKLNYLAPDTLGTLEILDIVNEQGKALEKADCNTQHTYIHTSQQLKGRESMYLNP
ncbi:MAG: U32 family peptidase [Candidatus Peribacteria bacterium]|jgi:putative protease|nr:U32 family peptidase [Candidatus Peribacteria bacterium]